MLVQDKVSLVYPINPFLFPHIQTHHMHIKIKYKHNLNNKSKVQIQETFIVHLTFT